MLHDLSGLLLLEGFCFFQYRIVVDFMISCFEAQKKENLELRTFFKCIADAKERDGKFVRLHNELFELSTVKGGL